MKEALEFIFSSWWVYLGTLWLIYSIGYAAALPFKWYYTLKERSLTKSIWRHSEN
tara:strand:+ start:218 stop:382 length:165 start_codon:yes stop_codon:yes gene_type:complete